MNSKKFLNYLWLLVMAGILGACHNTSHTHPGKQIFYYNSPTEIVNLDPAFARDQAHIWVCNQLYNGLVKLDDSLHVKPSIAKSWKVSDDGKIYTFDLRNDVYFHNDSVFKGKKRKVVASDFVYSFQRLVKPKTASPGSWVFDDVADANGRKAFEAINDTTLQIRLKKPFPPFLGILTMKYCSVIPREAIQYYGQDFRKHPVGTGPFFLKNWVENVEMVLQKNPDYFEFDSAGNRLPYLDAVAITFLADKMTAFLEFTKGKLDFISGIAPSYRDEILTRTGELRSKYRKNIRLMKMPYLNTEYLGMMVDTSLQIVKNSPLRLKAVRQAINYGIDRVKMIKFLRNGIGIPGNKGIIPAGLPAYNPNADYGYLYNPEKAKLLLKEAGFGPKNRMPPITLATTSDYLDLCKFVQSQLDDIGFDIRLNIMPPGSLREMKAQAKLVFFRASWIADYPDAENYLSLFYSKNFTPDGPNYTHFYDPKFDVLYQKSLSVINERKREKLYREMDSMVMQQAPVAILYYDEALRFIQKRVEGMTLNPINLLNLEYVKIDNKR
ncbi:MAG: ABC transporter substrate-binding protein [Bacteroidales bacterium]|nr:ABC transporter substrate-binding protein [Bacteroidales bacterium]